jgi:hypothetical protein
MSRLDQHISAVRNKLTLGIFLDAWAWTGLLLAVGVLIAVIGQRVLDRAIAHPAELFLIGAGATVLGAWISSIVRRPSADAAAVKIDEALGMKEKFSTALYARPLNDPFAQAAVRDAEAAAMRVSLYNRFPLKFPRQAITTAVVFLVAFLVAQFMPPLHLFAKHEKDAAKQAQGGSQSQHNEYMKQAMPTIMAPAALANAGEKILRATDELNKAVATDEGDELRNHRSVLSALQDYNKTMVEELKKNEKFQTAMEEQNEMSAIAAAKDDSTPIGKAQNELKGGDLDAAMNDISKAVNQFDKMKEADQQKMIAQAAVMAQELSKAANDPRVGQKIAQQLMQMGATQSQAQQMSAAMQQAAQGNKQAQQQLQQMARQMAQQMNNGQGPTQQQQQQIQSMMTQAQAMANSQMRAQALSSAAQQLSMAMVQARAAGQQQQSSPGQQSPPGQGQGQQPGAQQQPGMAAAQQQMQQQLQQMQANAKDAQAMQAAASAAAQAAADAAAGLNGPSGGDTGGADASGGTGQNPNQGGQPGPGNAGWSSKPGKGGARMGIAVAPATFRQELDPSKDNEHGKILASRYVKAGIDPGQSTAGLKDVAASAEKDAPDDIDQDHIPREAQQAEKEYFSAMQKQDGQ